jgi:hypothetical protein
MTFPIEEISSHRNSDPSVTANESVEHKGAFCQVMLILLRLKLVFCLSRIITSIREAIAIIDIQFICRDQTHGS